MENSFSKSPILSTETIAVNESWDDMKHTKYDDEDLNDIETEAINRITNYTYHEPKRYHYLRTCCNEGDGSNTRKCGTLVFVVVFVVVGAVLIGLFASQYGHKATVSNPVSNITSPAPKYTPIQNHNQKIDNYTPQQLLELTEQINLACKQSTIYHEEKRRECQLFCQDKMCCFEDDNYGCSQETMCSVYAGCEVLYEPNVEESTISKAVSKAALLELADEIIGYCDEYLIDHESADGQECIHHCEEHMCCFEDTQSSHINSCKKDSDIPCLVYEGCEILVKELDKKF